MQKASYEKMQQLCKEDSLAARFGQLIACDTQSDENNPHAPSSQGQTELGLQLASEISKLGFAASRTAQGVVIAEIKPAPGCEKGRRLCLLAHLDTAPDASGRNVKPHLVENYAGGEIELENGIKFGPENCPALKAAEGSPIIVTDGTTLLGADDKAGVAILMQCMQEIAQGTLKEHGPLCIVFSVDEEIGRSSNYVPVEDLHCDCAVTVDGCALGELDVATFSAKGAVIKIKGRAIHTAAAKGRLINANLIAAELIQALPAQERPEKTDGRDGFYHVYSVSGTTSGAEVRMILRDFEDEALQKRADFLLKIVHDLNTKYGAGTVQVEIKDQYRNPYPILKRHPDLLRLCHQAYAKAGVKVNEQWVRGGTDGSNLSWRGLPCPNFFTGGLNPHSVTECLPLHHFHQAYAAVRALIELCAAAPAKD